MNNKQRTVSAPPTLIEKAEAFFKSKERMILFMLLSLAVLFRVVYFLQLYNGPLFSLHKATETDMHFYDHWAKAISDGDVLTNRSLRQFTAPHRLVADYYFGNNPNEALRYNNLAKSDTSRTAGELLWEDWHGGKTFHQDPFYIYCIALIYGIFGANVIPVFIFQMLLGLGSILLIYRISRRHFGYTAAFVSTLVMILYGPAMFYELTLVRETTIIFMGLLLVGLLDQVYTAPALDIKKIAILGIALGAAVLLKITFGVFLLLSIAILWFKHGKNNAKSFVRPALSLMFGFFLIYGLLIFRNAYVGAPLFSQNVVGPITLVNANVADFKPENGYHLDIEPTIKAYTTSDRAFSDLMSIALDTHPDLSSYISLLLDKISNVFHWYEIPNNKNYYIFKQFATILNFTFFNFILVGAFGIMGLILSVQNKKKLWPLYLLALLHFGTLVLFTVLSRFRIPFAVALMPFVGYGIVSLVSLGIEKQKQAVFFVVLVLGLGLYIARPLANDITLTRPVDYINLREVWYTPKIAQAVKNKEKPEALVYISEYLALEPKDLLAPAEESKGRKNLISFFAREHAEIASYYEKLGEPALAAAESKKAGSLGGGPVLTKEDQDVKNVLALAEKEPDPSAKTGYIIKARQMAIALVVEGKNTVDNYNSLGMIYEQLGNNDSQLYFLKKACELDPNNDYCNARCGYLYAAVFNDLPKAIPYMEKARSLNPGSVDIYKNLAIAYLTTGQYPLALERVNQGLAIDPNEASLKAIQSDINKRAGQ